MALLDHPLDLTLPAPAWGPNGREVYERTYSRIKEDGASETWADTVVRVVDGNLGLGDPAAELPGEREDLIDYLFNFKVIPAGRHLWTSGVKGRVFNRNCWRSGFGPTVGAHAAFTFSELMKGGGVGANYSSDLIASASAVPGTVHLHPRCADTHPDYEQISGWLSTEDHLDGEVHVISVPDTREGWVTTMERLLDLASLPGERHLIVDVSGVRPMGAPLKTFGGTASGPGPLLSALVEAAKIVNGTDRLTPIDMMLIDHHIAACVVAGNVRRSARMSILHWNDPYIFDFINCKADHMYHWSTNVSVEIDDAFFAAIAAGDDHAWKVFNETTAAMLANGEPGFYNSALASVGERHDVRSTNPCGEIALEDWESCNLGHVNLAAFPPGTEDDLLYAARLMTRFLLRATNAPHTDERSAAVEHRNRRLGVGIFGFQEWALEHGIRYSEIPESTVLTEKMRALAAAVDAEADAYSAALGVPRPIKTRTVAPTGTIAKLPGTTEGIHPVYSRYFERRIRYAASDAKWREFEASGHAVEDCIYSANTKVVVFHVADPITQRFADDMIEQPDEISVDRMLAVQAWVQEHWADNAVSFTVNVDPELSIGDLRAAMLTYLPRLKGTTIFPDLSRPQSPYVRISRGQYLAAVDHSVGQGEMDCASGACPIK